jgi:hypothetical protein
MYRGRQFVFHHALQVHKEISGSLCHLMINSAIVDVHLHFKIVIHSWALVVVDGDL